MRVTGNPEKECPRNYKNVTISAKFTAGSSTSGRTNFDYALCDIIAVHMRYANVSVDPSSNPRSDGYLWALRSSELGARIATNVNKVAVSTNNGGVSQANTQSNIIGLFGPTFGQNNEQSQLDIVPINSIMRFSKPQTIQSFDWSISHIDGSAVTTPASYCCEIILTFYPVCCCYDRK